MFFNYACDLPMNFRISYSHSPKTSSLKTRCGVEEGLVHAGRGGKWWQCWSQVGPIWAQVELQYVGPRLLGMLAYVGAVLADVGAMLDPGRPMLGPSWPLLGLCCGRGPMLVTGGPRWLHVIWRVLGPRLPC